MNEPIDDGAKGPAGVEPMTPAGLQALREARWPVEKVWRWYRAVGPIAGCNYLPRSAVNSTEMWQADTFDPATIDEELGWAEAAGYNSVRVFLPYIVWQDDPAGLKQRLDQFLATADRHGISTMLTLFCDCGFSGRDPYLGQQDDPLPGKSNGGWTPSPGLRLVVDGAAWPDLKRYVHDILGAFADDQRVLLWDLYNEPGNSEMGEMSRPLAQAVFAWARELNPSQPLTIGPWISFDAPMAQEHMALSDVISFHCYDEPVAFDHRVQAFAAFGRPMICTEWLMRQHGNTFASILPILAQHGVGSYHWGLVAGKTQTYLHWETRPGDPMPAVWQHDMLWPDGKAYDAGEFDLLRTYCADFRTDNSKGIAP